jgi:hypothetical protein
MCVCVCVCVCACVCACVCVCVCDCRWILEQDICAAAPLSDNNDMNDSRERESGKGLGFRV